MFRLRSFADQTTFSDVDSGRVNSTGNWIGAPIDSTVKQYSPGASHNAPLAPGCGLLNPDEVDSLDEVDCSTWGLLKVEIQFDELSHCCLAV